MVPNRKKEIERDANRIHDSEAKRRKPKRAVCERVLDSICPGSESDGDGRVGRTEIALDGIVR